MLDPGALLIPFCFISLLTFLTSAQFLLEAYRLERSTYMPLSWNSKFCSDFKISWVNPTFPYVLQALKSAPMICTSGDMGIVFINSTASSTSPALQSKSTMQP
ncbi:hypothetical protein V8G54_029740 [Vigna mungo]|uniref:Uncharacterized protein n=1 Tax=Vigna mungo TaxID=3915 RepID=A0AAQ3MVS4_VIGMU